MSRFKWESSENHILMNPRFSPEERGEILKLLENAPALQSHFWIATSGSTGNSTGQIKWTALSKAAILTSAASVNDFLESTERDVWLNVLPYFHVGGLGIYARAHLSCANVIDAYSLMQHKWDAEKAFELLSSCKATLTSLVPAQLYDWVLMRRKAPETVRAVIVGGGSLSEQLYMQARQLGWNVLPTYGLTECASQVATAVFQADENIEIPKLRLLSHVEAKTTSEGRLALKSPSLLTLYALKSKEGIDYIDPKKNGWFETEDIAEVHDHTIIIRGRSQHFFKIGGESVDLLRLERILDSIKLSKQCSIDMALLAAPDERLGVVIHLAVAAQKNQSMDSIVKAYQSQVLPFERIRHVHFVESIPRTELGKLKMAELLHILFKGNDAYI